MSTCTGILDTHRTVEPTACYWAVLDASVLRRRHRSDPQRLGFLFEAELPCVVDELHAVYRSALQDRVIGCAVPRSRLEDLIRDHEAAIFSLTPASVPEFIGDDSVEPGSFNLLTGAFEPSPVRRLRREWVLSTIFLAAALGILLTVGFERRRLAVEGEIASTQAEKRALIADALGPSAGASSLPPEQRLISTLRRLEQTRSIEQQPASETESSDLVQAFFSLLAAWPSALHAQTELISITPESMTIRGRLPSSGDVQVLADALDEMDGWSVRQPQVSSTRDGIQAMLTLAPPEREERSQ